MRFILSLAAAAAVTAALLATPALAESDLPGKGVTVRPIHDNNPEGLFQLEVVNRGLERLGYTVKKADEVQLAIYYAAIASGERDYGVDTWWLEAKPLYENAGGAAKSTVIGPFIAEATQGYLIDKKTADAHGITKVEQLKDPKIAALFSEDGSGKAQLNGTTPGWPSERIIDHQIKAYGLAGTVQHNKGDYAVLKSDVLARYRNGKSVLYYGSRPHWINQILVPGRDVVWLDVDEVKIPDAHKDENTVTQHGWEVSSIRINANNAFLAGNPAAKRFFELVRIPIDDVEAENLLFHNGEKSSADIKRHADDWIAKNQATFDGWIDRAIHETRVN